MRRKDEMKSNSWTSFGVKYKRAERLHASFCAIIIIMLFLSYNKLFIEGCVGTFLNTFIFYSPNTYINVFVNACRKYIYMILLFFLNKQSLFCTLRPLLAKTDAPCIVAGLLNYFLWKSHPLQVSQWIAL